jgi:hypothetical protein
MNKVKKTSQQLGQEFEKITKDFFSWFFNELGFVITKERIQFSGTQDGFDIEFVLSEDYNPRKIFIECKNYNSQIKIDSIFGKLIDIDLPHKLNKNDIFIAINSKSKFTNKYNIEKIEPYLISKYNFDIKIFDIDNNIKELFALKPKFYKEIYGEVAPDILNKVEIINQFKEIIFSTRVLRKIILKEDDKENFIGKINVQPYISRKIIENSISNFEDLFIDEQHTLLKAIEKNDKILLLGNPGIGKTTELENLALKLWKEGEVDCGIPIFKNLKNFTSNQHIEDYLPERWNEIFSPILILDGLDEIKEIKDFSYKLNQFVIKNKQIKPKIVISCRTNIYYKNFIDLENFKLFYLDYLNYNQSKELLLEKHKINLSNYRLNNSQTDYIKSPFFLNLFAEYINKNNELPTSKVQMWQNYIDKQLEIFYIKIKSENPKRKIQEYKPLKTVALICELMQQNTIIYDNLYTLGVDFVSNFESLPFTINENEIYFFEHKQIQEYFTALSLSNKNFDKIIEIITIPYINKIHPSWHNTITFLVDLLEDGVKKELINWLVDNEIEILFQVDKYSIEKSFKDKCFQKFFNTQCVDKKLWINTNIATRLKEIADFACTVGNYDFLKEIVLKNEHERITSSALELLSNFDIKSIDKENEINEFLLELLNNRNYSKFHHECIQCLKNLKIDSINKVLLIFEDNHDENITRSILNYLTNYQNTDAFFEYLELQFEYDCGLKDRLNGKRKNDFISDHNLFYLINNLQVPDNYIQIIHYYFSETRHINTFEFNRQEIIEKCLSFYKSNNQFIFDLLKKVDFSRYNYLLNDKLYDLISRINGDKENIIKFLLNKIDFQNIGYDIAGLISKNEFNAIITYFKKNKIEKNKIDFFRNQLLKRQGTSITNEFEMELSKANIDFTRLPNEDELKLSLEKSNQKPQDNFEKLFETEKLLLEIQTHFFNNHNSINRSELNKLKFDWYDTNLTGEILDISYVILENILYDLTEIKLEDVRIWLNLFDNKLNLIQHYLENKEIQVNPFQMDIIDKWVKTSSSEIDFNNIMNCSNYSSFDLTNDYKTWKRIMFFIQKLDIDVNKSFFLNSLNVYFNSSFDDATFFTYLINKINDIEAVNRQIIENLNQPFLFNPILNQHIDYILDNKIEKGYISVDKHLKSKDFNYKIKLIFEKYYAISSQRQRTVILIKSTIEELDCNNYKYWELISFFEEQNIEKEYCISKTELYLENQESNEDFILNSLRILFNHNQLKAIQYYVKNKENVDLYNVNFSNYNQIEDYHIIFELFYYVYFTSKINKSLNSTEFLRNYIINLSKEKTSYETVNKKLIEIKEKINNNQFSKDISLNDSALFNLNLLIDYSDKSYYNAMSKKLNFDEALVKAKLILN